MLYYSQRNHIKLEVKGHVCHYWSKFYKFRWAATSHFLHCIANTLSGRGRLAPRPHSGACDGTCRQSADCPHSPWPNPWTLLMRHKCTDDDESGGELHPLLESGCHLHRRRGSETVSGHGQEAETGAVVVYASEDRGALEPRCCCWTYWRRVQD